MLIAWAPYYANRPDDWNLWSFLVLYSLLLAPVIAKFHRRSSLLVLLAILLVLPIPLQTARNNVAHLLASSARPTTEHCAAGISLPPEICAEHHARTSELLRVAEPGDIVWISGYPFLTLRMTGLPPLVAPLDLFAAALVEADIEHVVARIRAGRPIALLLDGAVASLSGKAIPASVRSFQTRIATIAGFAPCPLVELLHWQFWLPQQDCNHASTSVRTLQARASSL